MPGYRAILIAGPTASGKSAAAIALAERMGGTVVNADSMQVYRDLRVLTARPSPEDEARVPHALYGFVPAREAYSVGRWMEDAARALGEVEAAGCLPVFTGGTGLYFRALLEGLSPVPDIPDDVRRRWRGIARDASGPELHAMLAERDPEMARLLRPSDPQRIVRALEVMEATGKSLAEWQRQPGKGLLNEAETLRLFVAPERQWLVERIAKRFDAMIAGGALDEVRALMAQDLDPGLPAMRAHGVPALIQHLKGRISLEEASARVAAETRHYAKRQMTWARRNMMSWKWIEAKDSESLAHKIFSVIDV